MIYHWPRKNPLPKAQKIVVWTRWASGRVFSWRNISVDFLTNFPGPVVEFFLEEIFLGIFDANFPGPVVDFFLDEIFLRIFDAKFPEPVVRRVFSWRNFLGIFDSNFPGPVVEFFLGYIFLRILMRISNQKCSEIFLQVIRCGRGVVVLWCGRGGPVVEFFLKYF